MVVDRFPMFRLATLIARQLSSPIAARIKTYAVSNPLFGAAVCIRLAQLYHRCEWQARAWSLRLAGAALPASARPPPLPAQAAVNLGGDLLGEIIIFTLGSMIIIFEVNRQAGKLEVKELNEKSQWLAIQLSLEELLKEVTAQQADIDRLRAALAPRRHDHDDIHDSDNRPTSEAQLTSFEPINGNTFSNQIKSNQI